jgi:hypothetical protein
MSTATLQVRTDKQLKKDTDPFYSQANQRILKKSIRQLETGKGKARTPQKNNRSSTKDEQ